MDQETKFIQHLNNHFEAKAFMNSLPDSLEDFPDRKLLMYFRSLSDNEDVIKNLSFYFDCLDQKYKTKYDKISIDIICDNVSRSIVSIIKPLLETDHIVYDELLFIDRCMDYVCINDHLLNCFYSHLLSTFQPFHYHYILLKKFIIDDKFITKIDHRYIRKLVSQLNNESSCLFEENKEFQSEIIDHAILYQVNKLKLLDFEKFDEYFAFYNVDIGNYKLLKD